MKGDETVAHAYKTPFYNILSWRAQKLGADVVHSAENCVASACWVLPSAALHLLRQRPPTSFCISTCFVGIAWGDCQLRKIKGGNLTTN
ncbi:hypothetical protein DIPPA_20818 [Diplonema papillatum]|nr:hypothetical protein DIPPA_20818 [Diplonema papillatum]